MTGSQIRTQLSRIVDDLVIDKNEPVLDDMYPDLLSDPDHRDEAINNLIEIIEHYREEL